MAFKMTIQVKISLRRKTILLSLIQYIFTNKTTTKILEIIFFTDLSKRTVLNSRTRLTFVGHKMPQYLLKLGNAALKRQNNH